MRKNKVIIEHWAAHNTPDSYLHDGRPFALQFNYSNGDICFHYFINEPSKDRTPCVALFRLKPKKP